MEEANGSALKGINGMNGMNGAIKPTMNGQTVGPKRKARSSGSGFFSWSLNIVARLLTWYSIITVLFRCPPTLEACDEASPAICKHYFQLKHAVTPHVEPYYNTYAAPYVEIARPYYNTFDEKVLTPSWTQARKYGGPRVQQVQAFGSAQWEKNVRPRLAEYQTLAQAQYDDKLAPHVTQLSASVAPYVEIVRTNVLQTYHEHLFPSYKKVLPYAQHGYKTASTFTTERAVPAVVWAWNKTIVFLDGTVWPQLRVIYVENVEPQLVKIGQRLGRHNGKKPSQKAIVEPASSSATKASSSVTRPTSSASIASGASVDSSRDSHPTITEKARVRTGAEPVSPPEIDADEPEGEIRRIARETVAEDLKDWQERYAKAADEGAAEIEERVEEITKRMLRRNARTTGKSLVDKLKSDADKQLSILKHDIKDVVKAFTNGTVTLEEAQELVTSSVRRAGLAIKEKAQEVRTWRENYEMEMHQAVTEVAASHVEILDGIRDLALQKIGMKWAWMDGVTYKDWAKYHLLKSRFEEWQADLEKLVVTHPGLEAAQVEGANIEDEAMKTAASAAKELGRLKEVAGWKLAAGDDSDEFDSEAMKKAAEEVESAKVAAAKAKEEAAAAAAAAEVEEELRASAAEAQASLASGQDSASENYAATSGDAIEEAELSSQKPLADEAVSSTSAINSNEKVDTQPELAAMPILPNVAEIVASGTLDDGDAAQKPVVAAEEPEAPDGPEIDDSHSEDDEVPVSSTTTSVKPALFGAAAQSVPSRQPILDSDDSLERMASAVKSLGTELPSSLSSVAQAAFSDALSRAEVHYSQALTAVSAQISGTPKPVHEQMLASVTSAYSNVVASASSRYTEALNMAQKNFESTPTPSTNNILPTVVSIPTMPSVDWAGIEAIAAQKLNEGRAWAEEQYESAKVAVGLATPTPTTPVEHVNKMLENAQHNYYAGLGVAYARYSQFMAAASSAVSSITATPTPTDLAGSASSVASVASESAASAASVVGENVSAAAADVAENWDIMVSKISVQIYGAPTPTPWYENLQSAAVEYVGSATENAAGVTNAAGFYAAVASEEAVKQYDAVSSLVSELLVGKEPTFSESVYSRLAAAYSTNLASVSSLASAAQATAASVFDDAAEAVKSAGEQVVSAASAATDAAKDSLPGHDEL